MTADIIEGADLLVLVPQDENAFAEGLH
jgi:hypothetical protein